MFRVAIVYNKPLPSRYDSAGESKAVLGVLDAVAAVHQALRELSYDVTSLPLATAPEQIKETLKALKVDLIFNLFEGFPGEPETEALMPEAASELGIPCTGCSAAVLRLALDKARTKDILKAAGIATPNFQLIDRRTLSIFKLSYPCIVKPRGEDASHGLSAKSVAYDFIGLEKLVKIVSDSYGGQALVEEFISGREFNAMVLGNSVLPVSEIVYSLPVGMPKILSFEAKWEPDSLYFKETRAVCPAKITDKARENIAETALATLQLLGCRGYARVDMRLDAKKRLNVIEVNPNPDISPSAGATRQAKTAGMTYVQFIENIVQIALDKN